MGNRSVRFSICVSLASFNCICSITFSERFLSLFMSHRILRSTTILYSSREFERKLYIRRTIPSTINCSTSPVSSICSGNRIVRCNMGIRNPQSLFVLLGQTKSNATRKVSIQKVCIDRHKLLDTSGLMMFKYLKSFAPYVTFHCRIGVLENTFPNFF